jgi:hypothetical protein
MIICSAVLELFHACRWMDKMIVTLLFRDANMFKKGTKNS